MAAPRTIIAKGDVSSNVYITDGIHKRLVSTAIPNHATRRKCGNWPKAKRPSTTKTGRKNSVPRGGFG